MMMASRLIYGLANQDVLPRTLGKVSANTRAPWVGIVFSTVLSLGLIVYVAEKAESEIVVNLSSVTSLLLLCVFTVVNIACLILRRDREHESRFRSPGLTPALGAILCAFLVGPGRPGRPDLPDRRHPDADRRGPLGAHLGHQPRGPGPEDRFPRHRPPRVAHDRTRDPSVPRAARRRVLRLRRTGRVAGRGDGVRQPAVRHLGSRRLWADSHYLLHNNMWNADRYNVAETLSHARTAAGSSTPPPTTAPATVG